MADNDLPNALENRVLAMLARPTMYARTPEVLEALVLELLSVREVLELPHTKEHIVDLVRNRYKSCGHDVEMNEMVAHLTRFVLAEHQRRNLRLGQYYVQAETPDGESLDLFVTAENRDSAITLWRKYYDEACDGVPWVRVWRCPPLSDMPRAHGWEDGVVEVLR